MNRDVVRQGRLKAARSDEIARFLSSMDADKKIAGYDVLVDLAHVVMLSRTGIIDPSSAQALLRVLIEMKRSGVPHEVFEDEYEDIHAGIESYLVRVLGPDAGGRLHIGRSRNDEVATCIRLCLRDDLLLISDELSCLRRTLLDLGQAHTRTMMPGFTHFQHAQPTTLAHHLLAYEEMFGRDQSRIRDAYDRMNQSPLGAAAFASTTFPIDREMVAELLGFDGISLNTMDAVASRDGLLEALSCLAIMMVHISRACEELVIWSSPFVGFVTLPDEYCSTSSIMPQKRNPDTAEIMRARSGLLIGELNAALIVMKGLPLSYNRDLQDLTPHVWRGTGSSRACVSLLEGMLASAVFHSDRMAAEAGKNFSTATDLADLLVRRLGMPFRTAHTIVGRAVSQGSMTLKVLDEVATDLTGESLSSRGLTKEHVSMSFDVGESISRRDRPGGPSPRAVEEAIRFRRNALESDVHWTGERRASTVKAMEQLMREASRIAE